MTTLPAIRMAGAEKAAALLLAMDKTVAARILKRFDKDEIRLVTRSATRLGRVAPVVLDELMTEFVSSMKAGTDVVGSIDDTQLLLTEALPQDEVSDIMSEVLGRSNGSVWERLSRLPDATLALRLSGEHAQVAAFVLSKVTTACAASVLGAMSTGRRNEITRRMVGLRPVSDAIARLVEDGLAGDLLAAPASDGKSNPHARMADVMNKMERDQAEEMLSDLSRGHPETAEALRGMMFGFDDIVKLGEKARLILFEKVPAERLILALAGADDVMKELVLSSLTARARRMVEGELGSGQVPPAKEVSKARRAVAETALDLASRGEIDLAGAVA